MNDETSASLSRIIRRLEEESDPAAAEHMARYGITAQQVYGVKIPVLRAIAAETGKNHDLALALWETPARETRILASMIDIPGKVGEAQLMNWADGFDSWEVCDQCIMNLLEETPFAWDKAFELSGHGEEFVKRAGFVFMARLARKRKRQDDRDFDAFLPVIEQEADDNRTYVKKAVNWALREIGKRSRYCNTRAIETARRLKQRDTKAARWIAADALRELTSEAVTGRLKR